MKRPAFIIAVMFPSLALAAYEYPLWVNFAPQQPTDKDPIAVTIGGEMGSGRVKLLRTEFSNQNSTVPGFDADLRLSFFVETGVLTVVDRYEFTETIGPFSPGNYNLYTNFVLLDTRPDTGPNRFDGPIIAHSFTVVPEPAMAAVLLPLLLLRRTRRCA